MISTSPSALDPPSQEQDGNRPKHGSQRIIIVKFVSIPATRAIRGLSQTGANPAIRQNCMGCLNLLNYLINGKIA